MHTLQLVCTVGKDHLPLAEQIMNNLLGRQVDSNYVVRMYCIRGLGNMADIGGSQVHTCMGMYMYVYIYSVCCSQTVDLHAVSNGRF